MAVKHVVATNQDHFHEVKTNTRNRKQLTAAQSFCSSKNGEQKPPFPLDDERRQRIHTNDWHKINQGLKVGATIKYQTETAWYNIVK